MQCWTIIAAGGHGTRLSLPGDSKPKQFLPLNDAPIFWHAALPFARTARIRGIVFVFPEDFLDEAKHRIETHARQDMPGLPWLVASGGATRQESVRLGLAALPPDCDTVLIHDAARPFVSPGLINRVLDALESGENAVIPTLPVTDTIKEVDDSGYVRSTPRRENLRAVQTPQGTRLSALREAHERARREGWDVTDDASLLERMGIRVLTVPGDENNLKITTPADLRHLRSPHHTPHAGGPEESMDRPALLPCTGFGYDVHRYGGTRPFILGGVPIATDITISAHSDGDTLLHALIDALLGLAGAGDIGALFPDTDPACDNLNSGVMLAEALRLAAMKGITLTHADCTIVAQTPKIAPHREAIRKNIATLLRLPMERVGVKATTEEKLGFTGEKLGIKAYAVLSGLRTA